MEFQIENLSKKYKVKMLTDSDVSVIYALCKENPLYYQYCPPFVTEESIRADMVALPPRKTMEDKYYLGFYENKTLVAEVYEYLKDFGFQYVRLCFAKGNPQSEHFWMKNGFERTGIEAQNEEYVVIVLEKVL